MGQALQRFEEAPMLDEAIPSVEKGKLYNLELERRLKALSLTMDEYRRRVAIKLKGYKVGITSDREVDIILSHAPRDILAELESLWDVEEGKWQGWKIQNGDSMDMIRKYVLGVLEGESEE